MTFFRMSECVLCGWLDESEWSLGVSEQAAESGGGGVDPMLASCIPLEEAWDKPGGRPDADGQTESGEGDRPTELTKYM